MVPHGAPHDIADLCFEDVATIAEVLPHEDPERWQVVRLARAPDDRYYIHGIGGPQSDWVKRHGSFSDSYPITATEAEDIIRTTKAVGHVPHEVPRG